MKSRLLGAVGAGVLAFSSTTVHAATTLDFSDGADLGVSSVANLGWQDNGKQYLSVYDNLNFSQFNLENVLDGSYDVDTYVHSLDINMLYGPTDPNAGVGGALRINVYSVDPSSDWKNDLYGSTTWTTFDIGLSNYSTWDNWLTLEINQAHVTSIQIVPPNGNPFYNDIYPSFDNLVITQTALTPATVPLPAAPWLFGSGLLGMIGIARRKKAA